MTISELNSTPAYLSLELGKANKNGPRSAGYIHYRVLSHPDQQPFLTLVGNDGNGCYSKEVVPFSRIQHCVEVLPLTSPAGSLQALRA